MLYSFGKGRGSETLYQRAGQEVFCVLVLIQKFVLLLFVPLLLATGLDKLAIVAYILVLGVAKGLFLAGRKRFYQDGNLNWNLAIARENKETIDSSFLCLVYNGERYSNSVKRRAYLDGFLGLLPKTHGNTVASLIYALLPTEWRSFLYDSPTLGSFHSRYHLYSSTSRSDCPCSLAQLLGYFSITGALHAFDYQPLTPPFPMKRVVKAGLNKTIQLVMG